jgi:hypothetical protein
MIAKVAWMSGSMLISLFLVSRAKALGVRVTNANARVRAEEA